MNLKEAFRFQNKLQGLISEASVILGTDDNVMKVEETHLRSKVVAEDKDETVLRMPDTEYADDITELASMLMTLIKEKEKLSSAIRKAKNTLPIDIDSETSVNAHRQQISSLFRHMTDLKSSEAVYSNGGFGYRFNAEGNQVTYKCDLRRVTTINFDRTKLKKYASRLSDKADEISAEIDRCLVNSQVSYEPPFDVNASFAEVFELCTGRE